MSLVLRPDNRLFLALDLPDQARGLLATLARERAAQVEGRPVPEGNLHLTLRFLGRVGVEQGSSLAAALGTIAGMAAPTLRLQRVEVRPSVRRPRLLAAALEDVGGALARVHARLTQAVADALGTPPDDAPLWPHVTLVRLRRPAPADAGVAPLEPPFSELTFDSSRAALYDSRSVPNSGGGRRRYVPLASVTLIAPHGATSQAT